MTDSLYQRKQEGRLIDPALRARIAAYIDEFYEPVIEQRAMTLGHADFGAAAIEFDSLSAAPVPGAPAGGLAPKAKRESLENLLEQLDESFSTTVLAIIDEKGFTDPEVYKRAGISRQVFSNLRSKPSFVPARHTALALCVGLKLNKDEANDLLRRAGFTLSDSNLQELIIGFLLDEGVFDIMAINEALFEFDQPLL